MYIFKFNYNSDIRRLSAERGTFKEILEHVSVMYSLPMGSFHLSYIDEDGDKINVLSSHFQ